MNKRTIFFSSLILVLLAGLSACGGTVNGPAASEPAATHAPYQLDPTATPPGEAIVPAPDEAVAASGQTIS